MKFTPDFDRSDFSSTEFYPCCFTKSNTLGVRESFKSLFFDTRLNSETKRGI